MEATTTIVILLAAAAGTGFWLWALADALRRPPASFPAAGRVVWVVALALTHVVGALLYVFFGRGRGSERRWS